MRKLLAKIQARDALVSVVGLGYVGLPLVREFATKGFRVLGFDIDPAKVRKLRAGESYIKTVGSEVIGRIVREGRFDATADFKRLREPDAIIICVPTPLTKTRDPDLSFIEATARSVAATLRPGQLVVLESTTYPGTTEEVMRPILEARGLKAGKDFFLAFSPEREDPGSKTHTTGTIPKVVGGHDPASRRLAAALYGSVVVRVVEVSDTRVAEATKILENIYRCVNIALVNELKVLFDRMGIDVWEVIGAAATKPFGFQPFYPGPGLGGHCIPIDPFYLTWKAREHGMATRFIELAGEINRSMPDYVVQKTTLALSDRGRALKKARLLILGLAYKKDVDDMRESPTLELMHLFEQRGATVDYHDPFIPALRPTREYSFRKTSVPLTPARLRKYDAVVISTDHTGVDYAMVVRHARLVVDSRNATRDVTEGRDKIVRA